MIKNNLQEALLDILVCPDCHTQLALQDCNLLLCKTCLSKYQISDSGQIDLRLKNKKISQMDFELGLKEQSNEPYPDHFFTENLNPQVSFDPIPTPHHLSKELLSFFPKSSEPNNLMLDLGCGDTLHKSVCEQAGYEYIGLDYHHPKAPILGDAQALPFKDDSFEFVLSIAVMEHIQFPFIMIQEISRILKSDGTFIGTVSFLEPFHGDSYYHHTHLGLQNMLTYGGFRIVQLAPNKGWMVFDAQARMASWAILPGMPRSIARFLIRSPQFFSGIWYFVMKLAKKENSFSKNASIYAGSFSFVVRKTSQLPISYF